MWGWTIGDALGLMDEHSGLVSCGFAFLKMVGIFCHHEVPKAQMPFVTGTDPAHSHKARPEQLKQEPHIEGGRHGSGTSLTEQQQRERLVLEVLNRRGAVGKTAIVSRSCDKCGLTVLGDLLFDGISFFF
jgi:hypothetical protein